MGFASYALSLLAIGQFLEGFLALAQPGYYTARHPSVILSGNYTAWGWVHIGIGIVAVVAVIDLFSGRLWARVAAVAVALVSALAQFAFFAAYPWWATMVIVLDVLVIYAVVVHGGEMREDEAPASAPTDSKARHIRA